MIYPQILCLALASQSVLGLTASLDTRDDWSTQIKNVSCNKVKGKSELVQSTQKHFCSFVLEAKKHKALRMQDIVTHVQCPDGKACRYALTASFNFNKVFDKVDDFSKVCNEFFDKLNEACPVVGGVADALIVNNGKQIEEGKIDAAWWEGDGKCTPDETVSCHEHHV